ncbi:MAG: 4-hydroxy-tetrahydrodipicolinate reductase, partial [Bacillota bacterium]
MAEPLPERVGIVLAGATGRTGGAVARALLSMPNVAVVGAVARRRAGEDLGPALGLPPVGVVIEPDVAAALDRTGAQVLVDFTTAEAGEAHARAALTRGVPGGAGTTG